jgi:hypothetical protein
MADIWRARLIGKYLKENPPQNDRDRLAPILALGEFHCQERAMGGNRSTSNHPSAKDRLDSIIFAHKDVREKMGCQNDKPDCAALVDKSFSRDVNSTPKDINK